MRIEQRHRAEAHDGDRFHASVEALWKTALGELLVAAPVAIFAALDASPVVSVAFLGLAVVVLAVVSLRNRRAR